MARREDVARILLLDDEDAIRAMAVLALKRCGHEVVPVSDGDQALELLVERPMDFDLIVTDVYHPGIATRRLRKVAMAREPSLPVVLFTGCDVEHALREVDPTHRDAHRFYYLPKPLSCFALSRYVNDIIDSIDASA